MREVITLHTGQAGVQLGSSLWDLTCKEHGIDQDGNLQNGEGEKEDLGAFFQTMPQGNLSPRALLVDLEPTVIDQVRKGGYRNLYVPRSMLTGNEDAANNFARGYITESRQMIPRVCEALRSQAEASERLQGFMLYHSFGGGTGSGLHARIVELISEEFSKKCKIEVAVFPSPTMATAVVEPYNCVLSTDATLEDTDCVFLADNEAIYDICQSRLDIDNPNYTSLNRLLAQTVSSITASLRYPGSLNADFTDFQTNLVPYPRIHFPVISYAPIVSKHVVGKECLSVLDITNRCFEHQNRMVKCETADGQYMACVLLYRGNIVPKDVNEAIHMIKSKKDIRFVGWSPTGFKVGINESRPGYLEEGDLAKVDKAVCLISNTTAIRHAWGRINHQFQLMYRKRAFIHWYLQEGMDQEDITTALDNLFTLQQDYDSLMDE